MSKQARYKIVIILLIMLLIFITFISVIFGAFQNNLSEFITSLFSDNNLELKNILIQIRIPRVLFALFIGVLLGVSGMFSQAITKNDLADPTILGINAGSLLSIIILISIFPDASYMMIFISSIIGASVRSVILFLISFYGSSRLNSFKIIIVGISINGFLLAISQLILVNNNLLSFNMSYQNSSLSGLNNGFLKYLILFCVISVVLLWIKRKHIDLLNLDDSMVKSLGINPTVNKAMFFIVIIIFQALSVSIAGPIYYLSLIVVHISKILFRFKDSDLFLINVLLSGSMLVGIDLLTRIVSPGTEISLNIMLSIIAAPILLIIINRKVRCV